MNKLSEKELNELNEYLNEISMFFYCNYPEILDNLKTINDISVNIYYNIIGYKIDGFGKTNNLTFEDVYSLSREIIESIDPKYLNDFDKLIDNGQLEFSYNDNICKNDYCYSLFNNSGFKYSDIKNYKLINIDRKFNYVDVKVLIHEYTHYLNKTLGNKNVKNNNLLTEFLAIYFELYAISYLIDKGIDIEEMNYADRLCVTLDYSEDLILSSIILLSYQNFGNIDENTYKYLDKLGLHVGVDEEKFNNCLRKLYSKLNDVDENLEDEEKQKVNVRAQKLSYKMFQDTIYTLGTALAFYAMGYSSMDDIIWLNDNIENYDCDAFDLLKKIHIDINDSKFNDKVSTSIKKYMNRGKYDNNNSRSNSSR